MHTIDSLADRMTRLESTVQHLDDEIRGNNWRPGLLKKLDEAIETFSKRIETLHNQNVERMDKIESNQEEFLNRFKRWIYALAGFLAAVGILTGSGTVTVHNLLKILGWIP